MLAVLCLVALAYAEVATQGSAVANSVTALTMQSQADGSVLLRVSAAEGIRSFQRPERTKDGFVLRIPDCAISASAVDSVPGTNNVSLRAEQVRTTALVRVRAKSFDSADVRREGLRTLVYTFRSKADPDTATKKPTDHGRWSLDVVVIDAGHGGQDAGAEGINGVYEKDVTLSIAKKLRDRIAEMLPKTKVVMTRDTDVFVELYRRTQIANEAGGKLFISIHCNSMPTKPHPAHGCETYILRPGRNDDAARVAARENSSVRFEQSSSRYAGMTEEQIIIATMAQRSFVRLSEQFASTIQREVHADTPLHDRGVNQAGFFVLVGASMPNVLVETGFLSNTTDAAYLASKSGQESIANALATAIRQYSSTYERSLRH